MIGGLIAGAMSGLGASIESAADQSIAARTKLETETAMSGILRQREEAAAQVKEAAARRQQQFDVQRRSQAFDQADAAALKGREVGPTTDQQEFDTRRGVIERQLPADEASAWAKGNDPLGRQKAVEEIKKTQQEVKTGAAHEGYYKAAADQVAGKNDTTIEAAKARAAGRPVKKPEDIDKDTKEGMAQLAYVKTTDQFGVEKTSQERLDVGQQMVSTLVEFGGLSGAQAARQANQVMAQADAVVRKNPKIPFGKAVDDIMAAKAAASKKPKTEGVQGPPADLAPKTKDAQGPSTPAVQSKAEGSGPKMVRIEKGGKGVLGGQKYVVTYDNGTKESISGDEAERLYILHKRD